jgi:N-methylhydantoinase B
MHAPPASSSTIDTIPFSLFVRRVETIAEEMSIVLARSAWSSIISLSQDYSCAIHDAHYRQVAMARDAVPIHCTSIHLLLAAIDDAFSEGDVAPGDIFLCNDPRAGNAHIGDLVTAAPVFIGGALLFWSVVKGHQLDVGAAEPTTASTFAENIWQEGLTIPPVRLVREGRLQEDVLRLYLANMRYPEILEGDLRAQLGAVSRGRERLGELCAEYGSDVAVDYSQRLIEYAHRRMHAEIDAMPDGTYTGERWLDTDAYEALDVPIKASVTIDGDRVVVDFTGSGRQGRGGINGTPASALGGAAIPFLHYIDPDIPRNQGCLDHITVVAPEGTICNAAYPASTHLATFAPTDVMQDAVNAAMVEALPERVPAGGARAANNFMLSGEHLVEGRAVPFGVLVANNGAGFGAAHGTDGWPLGISNSGLGAIKIQSIEQLELLHPLRVEHHEVEPDSMGMGEWIGGPGNRLRLRPLLDGDAVVITMGDGMRNPPHGVLGGTGGIGGGMYVEDEDGSRRYISVTGAFTIRGRSQVLVGVSSGGGGFGDPVARPAEVVCHDVLNGVVTRETARDVFGVVLSDGVPLRVDERATRDARERLSAMERRPIDPASPNAATWLDEHMRASDTFELNPRL